VVIHRTFGQRVCLLVPAKLVEGQETEGKSPDHSARSITGKLGHVRGLEAPSRVRCARCLLLFEDVVMIHRASVVTGSGDGSASLIAMRTNISVLSANSDCTLFRLRTIV